MKKTSLTLFIFLSILRGYSQNDTLFLKSGYAKYAQKDYAGAMADYTKAIKLNPLYADAFDARGYLKCQLLNYKGAIADYNRVIKLDSSNISVYCQRGYAKIMLRKMKSACADFWKGDTLRDDAAYGLIIKYCPCITAKDFFERGCYNVDRAGDDKTAILNFTRAIELDSSYWLKAYYYRGISKFNTQDYQGSIEDDTKVIELNPKVAYMYRSRGYGYFQLGEIEVAIKEYNKALELDSNDAPSYSARGEAKEKLEDYAGAMEDYNRSIELDSTDKSIFYARAFLNFKHGSSEQGCLDLIKASELGYYCVRELIENKCKEASDFQED